VASMAAKERGIPFLSHYVASKFGVHGLTQAMSYELAPQGIRCLTSNRNVGTCIWEVRRNPAAATGTSELIREPRGTILPAEWHSLNAAALPVRR
jgi:NAD(P)-dependent dehydrogenase (short-subunit alcohol dehydrogenase family)